GDLLMTRVTPRPDRAGIGTQADPVMLEIFNNLFMSVAEQMGVRLQATSHSVNIKERLDFSCALFDADGGLIANAPHMPVHLRSMDASVRAVRDRPPRLPPGPAVALKRPDPGGPPLPALHRGTPVLTPRAGPPLRP